MKNGRLNENSLILPGPAKRIVFIKLEIKLKMTTEKKLKKKRRNERNISE